MMALRVRGVRVAAVVVAASVGVTAAVATAAGSVTVASSKQTTAIGKVLVSASGRTLYHYSSEKASMVKCTGPCAAKWPPLLIAAGAKPTAGPGVTAKLLGTVKRPDGKLQVTYRGKALYLFSGDKKVGDVKGQGNGGSWYALAPSGAIVKKAATTSTPKTGSGGSTGSGSSGGSSGGGGTSPPPSGGGGTSVNCDLNPMHVDCGM